MYFFHFCLIFTFFSPILALKPIFLIAGFENSPIYSQISDFSLYPECPSNTKQILIKDDKSFNTYFISRYPNCVAKLLRVQTNTTTGKIEQLPGIATDSTSISDSSIFSDKYSPIITEIKQLGYRDNINLFGVGYNHFLHPITSFSVYKKLKNKIEQVYSQTGEKSILITFNQGSSFTSIFLSNYSKPEWAKQYIDSVIFISPTFAGFPSISNLLSQTLFPFTSNAEFKKSLMRMPGFHISLPNYIVYENYTLYNNLKTSQIFKFLKDLGKFDDESEKIFKTVSEKYLKSPIPEPPIPSIIINDNKISETEIKPIISTNNDSRYDDSVQISSQYACSRWKTAKCIKSNKLSQFIFEYINGRLSSPFSIRESGNQLLTADKTAHQSISGVNGNYANNGYVTSHSVNSSEFTYSGLTGKPSNPLSNAFDGQSTTYFISDKSNDETYNNTLEITFTKVVSLEAFLYDTAFMTKGTTRTYHGFPTLLYVYTSIGENSPYNLSAIFEGTPSYPDARIQFVFPRIVTCDRLKLVFVEVTQQTLVDEPAKNPVISELIFIRYFYVTDDLLYRNDAFIKTHAVPNSDFTYTATEGDIGSPISYAFDGDPMTNYISSIPNNETYKNFVEINFTKTETLESFIYRKYNTYKNDKIITQGFPTKMIVYTAKGNDPFSLKKVFDEKIELEKDSIGYNFGELIECDRLKIEFDDIIPQTMIGTDPTMRVVCVDLFFIRFMNESKYTNTNFNYSSDAYLITYSVDPSKFVYSGDEGKTNEPLSNAFDGDPSSFYVSLSESDYITLNIDFSETVSLTDIVYNLGFSTSNGKRNYQGFPSRINVYKSLGNEPFSLYDMFIGLPISPTTKIQLHFNDVVRCDKIKLEFLQISEQNVSSPAGCKNLVIGNLYFIPIHEADIIPISGASEIYLNDTFVLSNLIENSEFNFIIDSALAEYPETNLFDKNPSTFYVSSTVINLTYHSVMEITFVDQVILNAFLIDSNSANSGNIYIYRGYPTGIKVYSSINGNPYELKAFFIGEPVYPWKRIQYIFPEYVQCDKLKLEFVHATQMIIKKTEAISLCIGELYLMRAIITPSPSPSYSPTFSPSPSPSPSISDSPSQTPSFTPTEIIIPSQIPITDVCQIGSHCSYEGSIDNQVSVIINTTTFNNIQSSENGGAVYIRNAGLNCSNIKFSGCQTKKSQNDDPSIEGSGGGGIYIRNDIDVIIPIVLNGVNFSNCKANYGGAIYIYSSSDVSSVNIVSCFFSENQATSLSSSSLSDSELIGGSAIFITAKESYISDCTFYKNIGESQLKIENIFEQDLNLLQNQPKKSNMIRYCKFVIERQSKTSLFYMAGDNGVFCYLMNSVFIGDLMPGNYHMNGKVMSSSSTRLVVVRCKFSSDYSRAFKNNEGNEYITIQFQKQTFNYNENKDDDTIDIYGYIIFGVVAILAIVIIIVMEKQCESMQFENKDKV